MPKRGHVRSRNWCWTIFARNDAEAELFSLADAAHPPIPFPLGASYCVFEAELCPDTHRVHLQGYSHYTDPVSAMRAKADLGFPAAHIERCFGSPADNIKYCTKGLRSGDDPEGLCFLAGPWEHGERPCQGRRTDWHDAREAVLAHAANRAILDAHPNLAPNFRGVEVLRMVYEEHPIRRDIAVSVLCGPTGVGKTYRARMQYPDAYIVRGKYFEGKSFDNYQGEKALILDEFRDYEWPVIFLLGVLDEWGFWITCRYANKWACWERVILTTNQSYDELYINTPDQAAFQRRIHSHVDIASKEEFVVF